MRIKIEMYVEVDAAEWASTNGMEPNATAVKEDVRSFVFHAVQQLPMIEETGASVTRSTRC